MEIEDAVALVKKFGELNQATNDALILICAHLSQEQPELVEGLRQTFRNLSAASESTPAMAYLSSRLAAALSGDFDGVVLDSLNLPTPEERRSAFRVISDDQDRTGSTDPS
ncbi:hypothetical protein ACT048_20595 [Ectopseudomonas khazarica]|uniref:hypothetical protein n=1 Tax=Ectopseudomonas khazarica TaxID=2502979 RepID=UPI0040333042